MNNETSVRASAGALFDEGVDSILTMFERSADAFPDHEAIVCGEQRITYRRLEQALRQLSALIADRVTNENKRVGILLQNGPEYVCALYACFAAGVQAVPMNPRYTASELAAILEAGAVRFCICGVNEEKEHHSTLTAHTEAAALVLTARHFDMAQPGQALRAKRPDMDSIASIQYTGGTTGRPKGVVLTHRTMAVNVCQRALLVPMVQGRDRILCITPLFHGYAATMAMYAALGSGGALVILPRFTPDAVFATIAAEKISLFAGTPSAYAQLVSYQSGEPPDLSSLQASFSGSAPLPGEIRSAWEKLSSAPIVEGYGLTESSGILTFNPRFGLRKPNSVGLPLPGTEIELVAAGEVKSESGTEMVGEIRARGPQMMLGYRNAPEATQEVLKDGWLYTGDLGAIDQDGYIFIRGRAKDLIPVSGFNVYPQEIENLLFKMPGVIDCAVVGMLDAKRGEAVHACVVTDTPAQLSDADVMQYCSAHLARYKVPVAVHFVDFIPKTPIGKTDRKAVVAAVKSLPASVWRG